MPRLYYIPNMTARIPTIDMDDAFTRIGNSHSILNNQTIIERHHRAYADATGIKEQFILTQNNLKQFKKLFGPPEFSYQSEYREYVWFQQFEGVHLALFTGEHGTAYEVVSDQTHEEFSQDSITGEIVARFLTDLTERLHHKDQ